MDVHITDLYGMNPKSTARISQNMVAKIGRNSFHFDTFSIFDYHLPNESENALNSRFDGIIASLKDNDTVIIQSPSWISTEWDDKFINHLNLYRNIKKIIFVHDILPLMFESNRYLMKKVINYYNKADLLIVPSKRMYIVLKTQGLQNKKYVVQHMWDHPSQINPFITPKNNKVISFAGDPQKFTFTKKWSDPDVRLQIFADKQDWGQDQNIEFMGWQDDPVLLNTLRTSGGFGLVWGDEPYLMEYMKLDASYKLSTYLAAGIPIIVSSDTPEAETISKKNLGIVTDNLDEAIQRVKNMTDEEYQQMAASVDQFAKLIRGGYFTKRASAEAVFKVRYE